MERCLMCAYRALMLTHQTLRMSTVCPYNLYHKPCPYTLSGASNGSSSTNGRRRVRRAGLCAPVLRRGAALGNLAGGYRSRQTRLPPTSRRGQRNGNWWGRAGAYLCSASSPRSHNGGGCQTGPVCTVCLAHCRIMGSAQTVYSRFWL